MVNSVQVQAVQQPIKLVAAANVKAKARPYLRSPDFPLGEVSVIAGAGGVGGRQDAHTHLAGGDGELLLLAVSHRISFFLILDLSLPYPEALTMSNSFL